MSRPTVDQASKQNFVVNIQDSEFGKLVVRWRERDIYHAQKFVHNNPKLSTLVSKMKVLMYSKLGKIQYLICILSFEIAPEWDFHADVNRPSVLLLSINLSLFLVVLH